MGKYILEGWIDGERQIVGSYSTEAEGLAEMNRLANIYDEMMLWSPAEASCN